MEITYETFLQKIFRLIFGRRTPSTVVYYLFWVGMVCWLYFFIWHLLSMISLMSVESLNNPAIIKAWFQKIGTEYGVSDAMKSFETFVYIQLALFAAVFAGLTLIYRRLRLGYFLYLGGHIGSILVMIFMFGFDFYMKETSMTDKVMQGISIVPFLGMFFMTKKTAE